jgi:immune inhibitor A
VLAAVVLALAVPAGALSAGGSGGEPGNDTRSVRHDLETPLSVKQDEARAEAIDKKVHGKAGNDHNGVVQTDEGDYVELEREDTDRIFVILAEFGDLAHAAYPVIPEAGAVRTEGPLHNEIPAPNRAVDNSTLWQADYSPAHYEDMYFNRMAAYYEKQSSGRYSVDGDVVEWVKVPFNERRYGSNDCDVDGDVEIGAAGSADDIVCSNVWFLVRDAMAFWVQDRLDDGMTMTEIQDYLKTFDVWDRYDINGNGNFDEPDGVIDHFQIVHAGGDEAAGDPIYGQDAIWSHRWAAQLHTGCPYDDFGVSSMEIGRGGTSSGQAIPDNPTGICVFDYTIQPENGGLGVFAHEYAHDLGLPDLYDTSGNTGGAENSTGFWTLMSSGSNIGDGGPNGIGDHPTDLGAWEKFQLGWLDFDVAFAGNKSQHQLGPAEYNTQYPQGLFVVLPQKEVTTDLGDPFEGSDFYYSGSGDDLNNVMYRSVTFDGSPSLEAMARYDIELDWDYAYLVVSTNGGTTWTPVQTNLSTTDNPNGQNFGQGITGSSAGNWVALSASAGALDAYANQTVLVGFQYWTDGAVAEPGFQVDAIDVDGAGDPGGWTFQPASGGFRVTTGTETGLFNNYYVVERRSYVSYDTSLKTAYNFGFLNTRPDWVELFSYQPGVLISYWDTSHTDNNVGDHPGEGEILPIDAHPKLNHWKNTHELIRPRIQSYDSTFGLEKSKEITVSLNGKATKIPGQGAVSTFDDTKSWWTNSDGHGATGSHPGRYQPGWFGVNPPKTGTTIQVLKPGHGGGSGSFVTVEVRPSKGGGGGH